MENTTIKPATTNDIKKLNTLCLASKSHWNYPADWIEYWKEELTLSVEDFMLHSIFKICNDNEIVGFCTIEEKSNEYEIHHFWVKPKAMGNGYGKKLLSYILESVVAHNKPLLVVSDPNAEAFYKKFGFATIDYRESKPKGRLLPIMRYRR